MTTPRFGHTATLLLNGRVLIAGGSRERPTSSAELYDPSTGTFTPTGDMTTAHLWHAATLLNDGKVLIAGGVAAEHGLLASAELYDPSTGTFTATGDMATAPSRHVAILLNNGKVLVAGVASGYPAAIRAELYDPATGTFTVTGTYASDTLYPGYPSWPTATLLPDGRVLIAGDNRAELYDPGTGTFSLTGAMTTNMYGMYWHTATLLTNGRVLVAGGTDEFSNFVSAELYAPSTGTFAATGNMSIGRDLHTSTLLTDGTVLIAGGLGNGYWAAPTLVNAELYDPVSGAFSGTGSMTAARYGHTATLLADGRVLMAGGTDYYRGTSTISNSAELYIPRLLAPVLVATDLRFNGTNVAAGTSYSVDISGSNLTPQTFFDVRFSAPASNAYTVVLNWQRGLAASHSVPAGTVPGNWTINGVRGHEDESDHTGSFVPVSATITVSP